MYYGIYRSSVTGTSGCVKQFCATPMKDMSFAPLVQWQCPLCNVYHNFIFNKVVIADTPKKVINFVQYCEDNKIEMNIEVN